MLQCLRFFLVPFLCSNYMSAVSSTGEPLYKLREIRVRFLDCAFIVYTNFRILFVNLKGLEFNDFRVRLGKGIKRYFYAIFIEKTSDKSILRQLIDYIFTWFSIKTLRRLILRRGCVRFSLSNPFCYSTWSILNNVAGVFTKYIPDFIEYYQARERFYLVHRLHIALSLFKGKCGPRMKEVFRHHFFLILVSTCPEKFDILNPLLGISHVGVE